MKIKVTTLIFAVLLLSCHKDKPTVFDTILTNCPANNTCSYSYFDHADFSAISPVGRGAYRVFAYSRNYNSTCGRVAQFYLKISLNSSDFVVDLNQSSMPQLILATDDTCPCCGRANTLVPLIGGEIKGKRVSATTWLLNARIIFGTSASQPTDSIKVNQYFTLSKLP
jgi:hypothetical protein